MKEEEKEEEGNKIVVEEGEIKLWRRRKEIKLWWRRREIKLWWRRKEICEGGGGVK